MTVEEIKILLDRVQSLPPAEHAQFQLLVVVDCIEKLSYYGLTALVAFALGRRIIQGVLTGIRESRPPEAGHAPSSRG